MDWQCGVGMFFKSLFLILIYFILILSFLFVSFFVQPCILNIPHLVVL